MFYPKMPPRSRVFNFKPFNKKKSVWFFYCSNIQKKTFFYRPAPVIAFIFRCAKMNARWWKANADSPTVYVFFSLLKEKIGFFLRLQKWGFIRGCIHFFFPVAFILCPSKMNARWRKMNAISNIIYVFFSFLKEEIRSILRALHWRGCVHFNILQNECAFTKNECNPQDNLYILSLF